MTDYDQPDAVTKVARDMSEILELKWMIRYKAIHSANDRSYLPGGDAMMRLAPTSNLEAWENKIQSGEAGRLPYPEHVADEGDDDDQPELRNILFWSEQWRVEHNLESDRRPTLESEIGFLRQILNWIWENEPHFNDFAKDINKCRVGLENHLYAGNRVERTRVPCNNPGCERRPRLIKLYGDRATEDRYKCPCCKKRYDQGDYEDAYAEQLRSEGARRFVKKVDAVSTLKAQGRSEHTVRNWFEACLVTAYCDLRTRQVFAWWPEIWHLHTITRKRGGRAA